MTLRTLFLPWAKHPRPAHIHKQVCLRRAADVGILSRMELVQLSKDLASCRTLMDGLIERDAFERIPLVACITACFIAFASQDSAAKVAWSGQLFSLDGNGFDKAYIISALALDCPQFALNVIGYKWGWMSKYPQLFKSK